MKTCRICKQEKTLEDFHKKKGTPDRHRNECKECVKDIQKKYKEGEENIEKRKVYDKARYEEKREEILARKKEYHIENREIILEKKKKYHDTHKKEAKIYRDNNRELMAFYAKKYRKNHPHIVAWRSIVYSTLKRFGTSKEGHTIDELGYSAEALKLHMESLFKEGMSWDNHGEWHIDHIRPVISFSPETPISEVCSLENLQPLWGEENLSKSGKY